MNYRRANNILLALIIAVNLYVLVAPFSGMALNWWRLNHTNIRQQLTTKVQNEVAEPPATNPKPNHLIIPDAGIDTDIYDDSFNNRYAALHKGVWRYDKGSTPPQGGNTVLAGHRFTYTNPRAVFYSLDKVHIGSTIAVRWDSKQYIYAVTNTAVVNASDTEIQDPTTDSRLTIFTCTPLLHPTQRLVITAAREENYER